MSILYINSSPRVEHSNSRAIGDYLVDVLQANGQQNIVRRDLGQQPLPPINGEDLIAVHGSLAVTHQSGLEQLALSDQLLKELEQAHTLIISTAMHNFNIPVVLKQWVDAICRAGKSFKYTAEGPVGLMGVKRAYLITATGGTPVGSETDFASKYLEHICRFVGIDEVFHIDACGSKREPEQVIAHGQQQVDTLLAAANTQTEEA